MITGTAFVDLSAAKHTVNQRTLKIRWNGVDRENTAHPKYLAVILDRTLSYKQHTQNTR